MSVHSLKILKSLPGFDFRKVGFGQFLKIFEACTDKFYDFCPEKVGKSPDLSDKSGQKN